MARDCPECGHEVEYHESEVRLLTGTCSDCGKALTIVAGAEVSPGAPVAGTAAPAAPADGPHCAECDTPLIVRASSPSTLEVECPECETTLTFVQPGEDEEDDDEDDEEPEHDREPPPGRQFSRPRADFRGGPRRPSPGFDRPASRPCRQCGAPLRFSTGPRGETVGECDSCGNRFTLPPRRDTGGFRSPSSSRGGPPRRYRPGGDRPGRRPYGRPPGRYSDRDDGPRKRRRPRSDE